MGADAVWSKSFSDLGVPVVSFSFPGHFVDRSVRSIPASLSHIIDLSTEELELHRSKVERVCSILRRCPLSRQNSYVQNLLLRNAWQVADVESVYAVGELESGTSLGVRGGTAYACELFAMRFQHDGPLPIFFFDQRPTHTCWMQPKRSDGRLRWEASSPPVPRGPFAAIGTRELTSAGRDAISRLARLYSDSFGHEAH